MHVKKGRGWIPRDPNPETYVNHSLFIQYLGREQWTYAHTVCNEHCARLHLCFKDGVGGDLECSAPWGERAPSHSSQRGPEPMLMCVYSSNKHTQQKRLSYGGDEHAHACMLVSQGPLLGHLQAMQILASTVRYVPALAVCYCLLFIRRKDPLPLFVAAESSLPPFKARQVYDLPGEAFCEICCPRGAYVALPNSDPIVCPVPCISDSVTPQSKTPVSLQCPDGHFLRSRGAAPASPQPTSFSWSSS